MSDVDIYVKAIGMAKSWRSMRPNKPFFGKTLDEFSTLIAPSGEARAEIAELEIRMQQAVARRKEADKITRRAVIRIVNGVKGDPEEGEDGELLAAMGYLPHTARSSLIGVARRAAKAAQQASSGEEDEE